MLLPPGELNIASKRVRRDVEQHFFTVILSGHHPFLWKASFSFGLYAAGTIFSWKKKSVSQCWCNNRRTKWPRSLSNDCNNSCCCHGLRYRDFSQKEGLYDPMEVWCFTGFAFVIYTYSSFYLFFFFWKGVRCHNRMASWPGFFQCLNFHFLLLLNEFEGLILFFF